MSPGDRQRLSHQRPPIPMALCLFQLVLFVHFPIVTVFQPRPRNVITAIKAANSAQNRAAFKPVTDQPDLSLWIKRSTHARPWVYGSLSLGYTFVAQVIRSRGFWSQCSSLGWPRTTQRYLCSLGWRLFVLTRCCRRKYRTCHSWAFLQETKGGQCWTQTGSAFGARFSAHNLGTARTLAIDCPDLLNWIGQAFCWTCARMKASPFRLAPGNLWQFCSKGQEATKTAQTSNWCGPSHQSNAQAHFQRVLSSGRPPFYWSRREFSKWIASIPFHPMPWARLGTATPSSDCKPASTCLYKLRLLCGYSRCHRKWACSFSSCGQDPWLHNLHPSINLLSHFSTALRHR